MTDTIMEAVKAGVTADPETAAEFIGELFDRAGARGAESARELILTVHGRVENKAAELNRAAEGLRTWAAILREMQGEA
jgi:hypothetical protein